MTASRDAGVIYVISSGGAVEEKAILASAKKLGVTAVLILDSDLLIGSADQIPDDESTVIVRTSSYFRGCAISSWLEGRKHHLLNSFDAISLFGVKSRTDVWLRKHGLPAIPSLISLSNSSLETAWKQLGFPLVVKPDIGGFGKRVHLVRDELELHQISESIFDLAPSYQRYVYAQKYCDIEHDLRVFVLDREVLAVMKRTNNKSTSISKNVAQGGSGSLHTLSKQEECVVEKITQALPPGYFGVDILVTKGGEIFVCEINASCKFSETAKATGVDIASRIVLAAMERMRLPEYA